MQYHVLEWERDSEEEWWKTTKNDGDRFILHMRIYNQVLFYNRIAVVLEIESCQDVVS